MRVNPKRAKLLAAAAGLAGLISCSRAAAAEVELAWDQDLAFEYDRESYQRTLADLVEQSRALVSAELGVPQQRRLRVEVHSPARYEQLFGTAAAFSQGAHYSRGAIHVNGGNRLGGRFAGLLVHEMTHAFLDSWGTAGRLPTWLNEGLAERLAWRRMGQDDLAPNETLELEAARRQGKLVPLPERMHLTAFGYLQCRAAVLFLERRAGRAKVAAIVRRTLEEEPFERALDRELRWSIRDVEREYADWVEHLR
jgi:hypothetical protein